MSDDKSTKHVLDSRVIYPIIPSTRYHGLIAGFGSKYDAYPEVFCVKCGRNWPANLAAHATEDSLPACDNIPRHTFLQGPRS